MEEWLARFYDPANYPDDARTAVFRNRRLVGFLDDFAEGMRLAFALPARGGTDGVVNFSVSPLAPPLPTARREQTHVVRKSSDALYLHRERCGHRNAWAHSVEALLAQATSLALEAVCGTVAVDGLGQGQGQGQAARDDEVVATDKMEVALCAVRNLEALCQDVGEVRDLVRVLTRGEAESDAGRLRWAVFAAVGMVSAADCGNPWLPRRRRGRGQHIGKVVATPATTAARVLCAWYPFSREGDVHVAARHALRHAVQLMRRRG